MLIGFYLAGGQERNIKSFTQFDLHKLSLYIDLRSFLWLRSPSVDPLSITCQALLCHQPPGPGASEGRAALQPETLHVVGLLCDKHVP